MRRLAVAHVLLQRKSERAATEVGKLIPLFLCVPVFKASHLCFKLAYTLNQRRLLRLCGEDFFLKFYGDSVARGSIVDVLQSLRKIEHGLERAKTSNHFTDHRVSPV